MSIRHLVIAMDLQLIPGTDKKLPASHKLALGAVADDASDKTNLSFPGLEKVMKWSSTGKRRSFELLADLAAWGLIEQVTAGYPGRRAVYLVTLPGVPEAVDNSQKMGAESRTPPKMGAENDLSSAESRTPLLRNSLKNNQSSLTTHVTNARVRAHDDEHPTWRERRRTRRLSKALDDDYLAEQLGKYFDDFPAETRPVIIRRSALQILGRALRSGTRVAHPNAYVIDAITREPEIYRQRAFEQEGTWVH